MKKWGNFVSLLFMAVIINIAIANDAQADEYAKFVKVLAKDDLGRGFQATVTLPTQKTVNTGGFINFYVGLDHAECGISTKGQGWRWFANSNEEGQTDGTFGQYQNGDTVHIKLTIDDQPTNGDHYLRFYVNHELKRKFRKIVDELGYNNCRFIIGAAHGSYNPFPTRTPAWNTWHHQVTASNMKFKNADKQWVQVNGTNVKDTKFHLPKNKTIPNPQDYTVDTSQLRQGKIHASLKKQR